MVALPFAFFVLYMTVFVLLSFPLPSNSVVVYSLFVVLSHRVCVCVGSIFCGVAVNVLSILMIILLRKRELIALL